MSFGLNIVKNMKLNKLHEFVICFDKKSVQLQCTFLLNTIPLHIISFIDQLIVSLVIGKFANFFLFFFLLLFDQRFQTGSLFTQSGKPPVDDIYCLTVPDIDHHDHQKKEDTEKNPDDRVGQNVLLLLFHLYVYLGLYLCWKIQKCLLERVRIHSRWRESVC